MPFPDRADSVFAPPPLSGPVRGGPATLSLTGDPVPQFDTGVKKPSTIGGEREGRGGLRTPSITVNTVVPNSKIHSSSTVPNFEGLVQSGNELLCCLMIQSVYLDSKTDSKHSLKARPNLSNLDQ